MTSAPHATVAPMAKDRRSRAHRRAGVLVAAVLVAAVLVAAVLVAAVLVAGVLVRALRRRRFIPVSSFRHLTVIPLI
ncbi:MAG TPA: hypothetical protein VFG00_15170 [Acidothermaceae bacterium]|nr:hypothetical protein [Acidothermaceae bacterium]